MPRPHPSSAIQKPSKLHPRNHHQGRYDFARLVAVDSALAVFVMRNEYGESSIDFADPAAVKALNRALLKSEYGILEWDIPEQQLCPPVPGRADYLHHLADLLTSTNKGIRPKKNLLSVLDIGTGANGIYPLIGTSEYGWQFTATDINAKSLANVQRILDANPALADKISLRLQPSANAIFNSIVGDDDWFDLSMCNPPFHTSIAEAQAGSQRKWNKLGKDKLAGAAEPMLNFGGRDAELWCPGGELAFIERMITESASIPGRCFWFSTLVSKSDNLPALKAALKRVKALEIKEIAMSQGNKQSRFLAWTFLTPSQQAAWKKLRW
ncbi:23S rRNA (adenine(1618)-N(6))-methyltransferase RlmF [Undibacterium sp. 14-3-2]|uniref:23S rRNA (adenine(1618)-N(6))-methyltransferase RlmF n=1 Tax=Undibacterium sp. 14-3-2 TaxID=2800129 RepID=UPI001902F830|nr:23S rRNA (adenine(1618)-N(6))-methyltransferase RlmF [Undibacterium sp. 14-3-2]MBK1888815.1 23S rRNA (adenine(1618)-N(6))-methyltransferase RlmF [Undibacterium sp. 14-3-2]